MRVFMDATGVTPLATGLAKYSLKLLANLTSSDIDDYTILCSPILPEAHDLYHLSRDRVDFIKRNIPVIGPMRDLAYGKLKREIARCDIYHCLSSYLPWFGVPIPSVVTVHDLKYVRYPDFLSSRLKSWYLKKIIMRTLSNASHIIAVSDSTRRDLVELGADANKVTVVYEAGIIDESVDNSGSCSVDARGGDYFFFVGENRPHKNLDRLLEAYQLLVAEHLADPPKLVIAGNGTHALGPKIARLGLERKVVVLGPVSEDELVRLYRNAFALIFPSLYEGFGLPVLEAMSLGVPVITSNATSTAEVAGGAAELVDSYSSQDIKRGMARVLTETGLRDQLVLAGRERAGMFSWEKTAQKTVDIYDLLARKTAGRDLK